MEIRDGYKKLVRGQYRVWLMVAIVILLAEFFFGIVERGLGRYLAWQNLGREKIGRSWEAAQTRLLANTRLEAAQQEIRQRTGSLADVKDFEQLLQSARASEQVLLPIAQFAAIYRALPEIFQPLLVPPEAWVTLARDHRLSGAWCTLRQSTLNIFLLDDHDQAVYQSVLSDEQLEMIARHGQEQRLEVSTDSRFSQRVFSAEVFYNALERLPRDERAWLLRTIPLLIDPASRFSNFAVSNQTASGFVEVAFALDAYRGRLYYLPESWLIEYLLPALNESQFNYFE